MLIGIDIGTTNLKVAAYSPETGRLEAVVRRPTRTLQPAAESAELDAEQLWTDTLDAIREVLDATGPAAVEALAIGSMGESGVALDAHMQPVAPILPWYDLRLTEQAAWWRTVTDAFAIYQTTGLILDRKFSVNHLMWLRQHRAEAFARVTRWLCVPDYIAWRLCGEQVMDHSIASRTMLLDQRTLDWSSALLELAALPRALLPGLVPSGTRVGRVTPEVAAASGLSTETAVVTGGHDHIVGAFGAGVAGPGSVLDSTGTAAAVVQLSAAFNADRALYGAGLETFAFVRPDTYAVVGAIDLGGGAVEWLVRTLWGEELGAAARAFDEASRIAPGSNGCVWLPHLLGSGTPHVDALSRGAVIGLRPEHQRGHLMRGLLEGLAYWLRDNLEVVGLPRAENVVAIGGATRSPVWIQLKADVCRRVFCVPQVEESVALGAALLAGIGAGVFSTDAEALSSVRAETRTFEPDPVASRAYDAWYSSVYRRLYPALREVNAAIDRLVSS